MMKRPGGGIQAVHQNFSNNPENMLKGNLRPPHGGGGGAQSEAVENERKGFGHGI